MTSSALEGAPVKKLKMTSAALKGGFPVKKLKMPNPIFPALAGTPKGEPLATSFEMGLERSPDMEPEAELFQPLSGSPSFLPPSKGDDDSSI